MNSTINSRAATKPMMAALPGFEAISRYWDTSRDMYAAKLLPGEYYVTRGDEIIVTVLGSCVSACIRDTVFGIGGMNHFMLPINANKGGSWEEAGVGESTRYGNFAMERLINDILKNGGNRKNLEVKVFGGGKILSNMTDVGRKNIDFVVEYLNTEGLRVAARDLGDIYPRKVCYTPSTGKVHIMKLRSLHNNTIIERETMYQKQLVDKPIAGDVTLF
jgi:chemotaxis protein CheD